MLASSGSQTALMVAAYRARATRREAPVCRDPWAAALAGEEGEALASRYDQTFSPMELWIAVRTAYLDAQIAFYTASPSSIRQVVLLGAGLDTRAARLAKEGVRFFEVDHPSTQADKRRRLEALAGYPKEAPIYVACDFEEDDFLTRLLAAGLRADEPAIIIWEGVIAYLREKAIRATLRRIATGCHPRTLVLFDHLRKLRSDRPEGDSHQFVANLGEPVLFGTNDPLPMLYEEGFRHVRSVSFDEACLTLTGTYDRAREFRFQRMVLASRTPTGQP
jgi:methyltransferase (TIGR00027 family)